MPVSYGFRPKRRAHDAIAEIHHFGTRGYRWVLDADIEACFDSISHSVLMDRVRARVKDKRVLALVKAFLKAGILTELGEHRDTLTGTPQGGILSPLSGQHRPVRARRARDGAVEARRADVHLGQTRLPTLQGSADVADHPLRRRLRDLGAWFARGHRSATRRRRPRLGTTGVAAVTSQDPGGPHERRVRLPRLPHPVETQERHEQVVRLHLHRRPARPVGEGEDPCPDTQDIAVGSRVSY